MTNRVIDTYVKNFLTYHHKDWYWVINPITNEWVVAVSEDNGYTFYNRRFWSDFIMFYPLGNLTDNIKNWVVYKLGVPSSKHCYPDYMDEDYDWRVEFDESVIIKVIDNGELASSPKHDPHF